MIGGTGNFNLVSFGTACLANIKSPLLMFHRMQKGESTPPIFAVGNTE